MADPLISLLSGRFGAPDFTWLALAAFQSSWYTNKLNTSKELAKRQQWQWQCPSEFNYETQIGKQKVGPANEMEWSRQTDR